MRTLSSTTIGSAGAADVLCLARLPMAEEACEAEIGHLEDGVFGGIAQEEVFCRCPHTYG